MFESERLTSAEESLSRYFARKLTSLRLDRTMLALDLPCGEGRHAAYLAMLGLDVVASDLDGRGVETTVSLGRGCEGRLFGVVADGDRALPLAKGLFDLAVVIHPWSHSALNQIAPLLKPGGFLIFETFGGQGRNWLDLPRAGEVRGLLGSSMRLVDYRESKAGPTGEAVTVKLVALALGGPSENEV